MNALSHCCVKHLAVVVVPSIRLPVQSLQPLRLRLQQPLSQPLQQHVIMKGGGRTAFFSAYYSLWACFGTTTTTTTTVVQAFSATPPIRSFFTTTTTTNQNRNKITPTSSSTAVSAAAAASSSSSSSSSSRNDDGGDNNDDDDWYADFDSSEFETVTSSSRHSSYNDDNNNDNKQYGHDYQRDTSVDNSNIDLSTVNALIADRSQARKLGQFDTADAIRDLLLDKYGVTVWDREKTWRSGCSRSGSGMKRNGNNNQQQQQEQRRQGSYGRNFGPTGHDYELSKDAGPNQSPLSESEIHQQIAQRLECKLNRNFVKADEIEEELQTIDVHIHDGLREWRADGQRYFLPYRQSEFSQATDHTETIQSLLEERDNARKQRDYATADDIRDELLKEYNVEVDDRVRQWSVGGQSFRQQARSPDTTTGMYPVFVRRGQGNLTPEEEAQINDLVRKRDEAKRDKQFGKADRIRDRLRDEYSVRVDDRAREWMLARDEFVMSPASDIDDEMKAYIEKRIEERSIAKINAEYDIADAIRDELYDDYQVAIDDRAKKWWIEGPARNRRPST